MVLKLPNKQVINNLQELEIFVRKLTKYLKKQPQTFFVLLSGDLGAGKTTLTKLIIKNLGINERVSSPTFVILNQYQNNHRNINHMDAYRLTKLEDLGMYEELFENSLNIIEWPERLNLDWNKLPHLKIKIKIISDSSRLIEMG